MSKMSMGSSREILFKEDRFEGNWKNRWGININKYGSAVRNRLK
jgi:hypothetical protein